MADHNDLSFLLESLNQLLEQDADMLNPGVEGKIRLLQSHLRQILSFLRQNERRENDAVQEQLNEVLQNVEVAIHRLAVDTARYKMRSRLGRFLYFCSHTMILRDASATLMSILTQIPDPNTTEGLFLGEYADNREAAEDGSFHGVRSQKMEEDQEVLGFRKEVETLVTLLTKGDQTRLDIVSLVGNSGTGKTTLAKKVYNGDDVKHHFGFRAWVHVSWNYGPGELLQRVLDYAMPTTEDNPAQMKEENLTDKVSRYLQGRKYLIVIDGLCGKDQREKVKAAFLDEGNGSRILLITRVDEAVASNKISLKDIGSLNKQECWELLCRRIFAKGVPPGDKELETLGTEMAEKCEALPLDTISLLSGILARKRTKKAWSKVSEILRESTKDGGHEPISNKLLNYVHQKLPHHLSFCYLYFGMFGEGVEVPARQLIQLWIAEGFIQKKGTKKMEDLGDEYLEDLIGRSLIQVVARTDGGVKACKIHDNFQKFCIYEGKNRKFFQAYHCTSTECWQTTRRLAIHACSTGEVTTRRLAIHACSTGEVTTSQFTDYQDVRSFQLSIQDPNANLLDLRWILVKGGFELLRVLNLGFVHVHRIPNVIGGLIHLRYLRIRSPKSKHVPSSICNLLNLQTMDLRESRLSSMPKGIWKMQQLRHLHLGYLHRIPEPRGTKNNALGSLQTLSAIRPNKVARRLMVKAKFPNLRRLKLFGQSKQETVQFLQSLDHLFHLESLKITSTANLPDPEVAGLPDPSAFPLALTKITLLDTYLSAECLIKLERLPNLQILKLLRNSIAGGHLDCNAGGFPQLQVLHMVELEMEKVTLGGKAMRNLQLLCIKKCVKLTTIPDHTMWPSLQQIDVFWPSATLRDIIQQFTGKVGCKVQVHPLCDRVDSASNETA